MMLCQTFGISVKGFDGALGFDGFFTVALGSALSISGTTAGAARLEISAGGLCLAMGLVHALQ